MSGTSSIYVDFVDYDEVAHHAGVVRAESLRSCKVWTRCSALLERVAQRAPRPYHIVVLCDHGQSQGATFLQRTGKSLQDTLKDLLSGERPEVAAATGAVEQWGPVNVFLSQLTQQQSVTGAVTRRLTRSRTDHGAVRLGQLGQDEAATGSTAGSRAEPAEVVVVGSGNLGGIWFAQEPGRLALEQIELLQPGFVLGLARTAGVGFVVVDTAAHGPVALGATGVCHLADGVVEGENPLAGFDRYAREDLLHVARYQHAPDVYVNSTYDVELDEVAAFEELVGCHGGLGGWQTRPMLVYPAAWSVDEDLLTDGRIRGAEVLHVQLVRWLERLGHRADLPTLANESGRA